MVDIPYMDPMSYIYLMRLCSKCFAIRNRSAVLRGEAARRLVLCELKGNLLQRTSMLSNLTDKNREKDGTSGIWYSRYVMLVFRTWTFGKLENHWFLPSFAQVKCVRVALKDGEGNGRPKPMRIYGFHGEKVENLGNCRGVKGIIKLSWNNIFFIFSHQDVSIE